MTPNPQKPIYKPEISENTAAVLKKRYLKKDSSGKILETPADMFLRVAAHIAAAEEKYQRPADTETISEAFYNMMARFRFLPNSPTLMNAGTELGQLAACFVLPVEDSLTGIFESIKNAALIHKSGEERASPFQGSEQKKPCGLNRRGGIGPGLLYENLQHGNGTGEAGGTRRGPTWPYSGWTTRISWSLSTAKPATAP